MLARLDQELGPLRSSVDREGALLRVEGSTEVNDLETRVLSVVDSMGFIAQRIEDASNVPRWFRSESVDELSREEASILAQRWMKELADQGVIENPSRLDHVLQEALLKAFRVAARTGAIGALDVDETMLRTALDEQEARAIHQWIKARLGHNLTS